MLVQQILYVSHFYVTVLPKKEILFSLSERDPVGQLYCPASLQSGACQLDKQNHWTREPTNVFWPFYVSKF